MAELNVLISSAGRRVELLRLFQRDLSDLGVKGRVLAADMSATSAAYHAADEAFLVPRCTHDEFIPTVLEQCRRREIGLIVPTIDTELPAYAAHRDAFAAAGIAVHVSTPEVIAIAGDKRATHRWLATEGLPTVRQAEVADALSGADGWELPLIVKPVGGSAAIGVARVTDLAELRVATQHGDFVVQTIAPGVEHTIDVFVNRDGRCLSAVPRRRLEVRSGEVSKAITVRDQALMDLAKRVFERLPGAYGVQNVQVFTDGDQASIIEINPRFGGGFPLSWEAGARGSRWLLEELLGLPSTAGDSWQDGRVMLRYDAAVFVDRDQTGL